MKVARIIGVACLSVLLLGLSGCSAVAQKVAEQAAGEREDAVFTSTEGGFKILMPARPESTTETVPSEAGDLLMNLTLAPVANGVDFGVMYIDFPRTAGPPNVDGAFEGAIAQQMTDMDLKLVSKNKHDAYGHPTMDYVLEGPPEKVWGRIVVADRRMYLIQGTSNDGSGEAEYFRFLDTFELIPAAA